MLAWDRAGLERLVRYCARPIFAGEGLAWLEPGQRLVYHLPKPRPDGQTVLQLTPLEFSAHLAAPVCRRRASTAIAITGVVAPNAPLRVLRSRSHRVRSLAVRGLPEPTRTCLQACVCMHSPVRKRKGRIMT